MIIILQMRKWRLRGYDGHGDEAGTCRTQDRVSTSWPPRCESVSDGHPHSHSHAWSLLNMLDSQHLRSFLFSSQNPQNRHLPKEPLLVILKYHTSNWAQSSLGFPNNHLNNRMPLWEVEGILQPYL